MTISVIIPTYNGAKKLPNILQALAQQTWQDFETIVVVDGSTDNTIEVLAQGGTWGLKDFKYITQANGGRAKVRNTGAKEAKGELLIFFDDDMRPQNNTILLHKKAHEKHQNIIQVGGILEDHEVLSTDFQYYKAYLSRKWNNQLPQNVPLQRHNLFLAAANLSIPKLLFWQLEGFDERLSDAEDFDLGVRALVRGVAIYFDMEAVAWHDDFITCRSYIKRQRQYRKAHEMLLALKPELYAEFNQHQLKPPKNILKKLIYWVFGSTLWVRLIDQYNLLKVLPSTIRYKIYEWVVYSLSQVYSYKAII